MDRRRAVRIGAWATAGVLSVGLLAGIADAVTSTTTTSPAPAQLSAAGAGRTGHAGGLLRHLNHGSLWLNTRAGEQQVDVQLGTVSAVDPAAHTITVQSRGFTATYSVGPSSHLRRLGTKVGIGDIKVGDRVLVVALHTGSMDTIRRLADRGPA